MAHLAIDSSLRLPTILRLAPTSRLYSGFRCPALTAARHSTRQLSSASRRLQQNKPVTPGPFIGKPPSVQRWRPFRKGEWDSRSKLFAGAVAAATLYYIAHLEKIQESGRWRFIDISAEAEKKIGERTSRAVIEQHGDNILPSDHPLTREIARVASRIITAANLGEVKGAPQTDVPGAGILSTAYVTFKGGLSSHGVATAEERLRQEWEVFVIKEDDTPNAFVTGDGKIFIFTGILPYMKNDDGLATILGHEIAHQALRHIGETASDLKVMGALTLFLELLGLDVGFSRVGLTLLMMLPNSRKHEVEADSIGLRLMAQACFNPQEAVGVWERMHAMEEEVNAILKAQSWFNLPGLGDFLHTHPATPKRIAAMQQLVPAALQVRASSVCSLANGHYMGDYYRSFRQQQQAFKGLEYV
ncbi:hypothetical protein FRB94_001893 [Tulasnella sp. JGI-2019a]|nr:hypothetical protein FRB93_004053 [Tulasnella sp. JGI-2019a]KAG9005003.1 hypothetical protein FRB94_001893 [Tulasnella sp. JGI-2019a]